MNYTLDDPLPYIVLAQLVVGQELIQNSGGNTDFVGNRLYVQPGMMIKSEPGAGLRVLTAGASLIVGDRTYIDRWDAQATIDPSTGLTKLDLVRYYMAVGEGALRGVHGRPMALKRFVNGAEGEAFFQKRAPTSRPEWIETVELSFPSGRTAEEIEQV